MEKHVQVFYLNDPIDAPALALLYADGRIERTEEGREHTWLLLALDEALADDKAGVALVDGRFLEGPASKYDPRSVEWAAIVCTSLPVWSMRGIAYGWSEQPLETFALLGLTGDLR